MTTLRVGSSSASISYAPEFFASQLGFFADEGLEVEFEYCGAGPGAMRAVMSGEADIGLGGMWRPLMYRDRLAAFKVFAQLNTRCHVNVVSREDHRELSAEAFRSSVVLIPSGAPSGGLFLERVLRRERLGPDDVSLVWGFDHDEATALFRAGYGDFIMLTAPQCEQLVLDGTGFMPESLASLGGEVPWTVYYALPEFFARPGGEAGRFARALERSREWARNATLSADDDAVRNMLKEFYPSLDPSVAEMALRGTQRRGLWDGSVVLSEGPQREWQEMLVQGGLLSEVCPYEDCYEPGPAASAVSALSSE